MPEKERLEPKWAHLAFDVAADLRKVMPSVQDTEGLKDYGYWASVHDHPDYQLLPSEQEAKRLMRRALIDDEGKIPLKYLKQAALSWFEDLVPAAANDPMPGITSNLPYAYVEEAFPSHLAAEIRNHPEKLNSKLTSAPEPQKGRIGDYMQLYKVGCQSCAALIESMNAAVKDALYTTFGDSVALDQEQDLWTLIKREKKHGGYGPTDDGQLAGQGYRYRAVIGLTDPGKFEGGETVVDAFKAKLQVGGLLLHKVATPHAHTALIRGDQWVVERWLR